jgi:magnesium-transporting ATPase (P-type)
LPDGVQAIDSPTRGRETKERLRRVFTVTARKGGGPVTLFLSQFHQPLIYSLLVSAVVTGVLKSRVDASVILGVVLLNAVIGFIQESRETPPRGRSWSRPTRRASSTAR